MFWRSRVQVLARRPAIQTEIFRGFRQSLQANAGDSALKLGHNRFLPNPSQFTSHPSIRPYIVLVIEQVPLNKIRTRIGLPEFDPR
jgi:hypothetical protein